MVTVSLLGKLGQLFGTDWKLDIQSVAEAVRAIDSQIEGFANYLNSHQEYDVVVDNYGDGFDLDTQGIESVTICPYISGSGAFGRILTGAALLGASLLIPGAILGLSSSTIGLFGASMILGGVVELLSPQKEEQKDQSSFQFDSSGVARAVQGAPVPILFGNRFISPVPISVRVDNENISVDFVP